MTNHDQLKIIAENAIAWYIDCMSYEIDPKTGERRPKANTGDNAPLTDAQLADKDFLRKMCTEELAAIVRKNNGDIRGVPAINALWDRIDGKAPQAIHQTNETTIRVIAEEQRQAAVAEVRAALEHQALLIDITPANNEK